MMVKCLQNSHEKTQLTLELKIVSSFINVMQAFHRIQILLNKRNIKKLLNQTPRQIPQIRNTKTK